MTDLAVDATTTVGTFTVVARFDAGPGITALFGPSGSGKSVTLATIAGLVRPAAGTIAIGDRLVADAATGHHTPTQARGLGMVLQRPTLLAHRSPVDNVALAARGRDRAARRRSSQEWLGRVGAAHLADARTTSLSGGEQQRVALARALVGEPSVLLLDEPFSALDLPTRTALRRLVTDLVAEQHVTAVIVSHDVEDVTDLAHQVVLFEPGRTVATHRRGPGPLDLTALLSRGTRGS